MANPKKTRRELDPAEANLIDNLRAGDVGSALEDFSDIVHDIQDEEEADDEDGDPDVTYEEDED